MATSGHGGDDHAQNTSHGEAELATRRRLQRLASCGVRAPKTVSGWWRSRVPPARRRSARLDDLAGERCSRGSSSRTARRPGRSGPPGGSRRPRRTGWRSTAAMASPGSNRLARDLAGSEPMTRATAIVSPMARPRPSMTAPTSPPRLWGKTAPRIISHGWRRGRRPPPSGHAGTVSNTSRLIDVMIGVIMMARMIPAVKKLGRSTGPSNSVAEDRGSPSTDAADAVVEPWRSAGRRRACPRARRPPTGRPPGGRSGSTTGLRSFCGATSVMNRAMPTLTGTAMTRAMADGDQRAVDEGQRAEARSPGCPAGRGEEPQALLPEGRPRLAGGRDER